MHTLQNWICCQLTDRSLEYRCFTLVWEQRQFNFVQVCLFGRFSVGHAVLCNWLVYCAINATIRCDELLAATCQHFRLILQCSAILRFWYWNFVFEIFVYIMEDRLARFVVASSVVMSKWQCLNVVLCRFCVLFLKWWVITYVYK